MFTGLKVGDLVGDTLDSRIKGRVVGFSVIVEVATNKRRVYYDSRRLMKEEENAETKTTTTD